MIQTNFSDVTATTNTLFKTNHKTLLKTENNFHKTFLKKKKKNTKKIQKKIKKIIAMNFRWPRSGHQNRLAQPPPWSINCNSFSLYLFYFILGTTLQIYLFFQKHFLKFYQIFIWWTVHATLFSNVAPQNQFSIFTFFKT